MKRGSEEPRSRTRVEDPSVRREHARADVRDRRRRAVVLRAGEVVVVDRGDPLVLGAQLVEIARAVEAVEVDPPIGDG
jgi:precorrin-6B methylase 1